MEELGEEDGEEGDPQQHQHACFMNEDIWMDCEEVTPFFYVE